MKETAEMREAREAEEKRKYAVRRNAPGKLNAEEKELLGLEKNTTYRF